MELINQDGIVLPERSHNPTTIFMVSLNQDDETCYWIMHQGWNLNWREITFDQIKTCIGLVSTLGKEELLADWSLAPTWW